MHSLIKRLNTLSKRQAMGLLTVSAIASLLIYVFLFTQPAMLTRWYVKPRLDLTYLSNIDPLARERLTIAFALAVLFYTLGWFAVRRLKGISPWVVVVGGALLAAFTLLWMYPYDAADIFDNIVHGRILSVYHDNPFVATANTYKADPFFDYSAWKGSPSAYGPLWELCAGAAAWLAGNGVISNVIAFKLVGGIFWALSGVAAASLLKRAAPERTMSGVWLLLWNPLVLYETFGHGHNDWAMVFWIILAAWALERRKYSLSVAALVIGGMFKYIPMLLLPIVGLLALRDLPDRRARWRFVITAGLASLLIVAASFAPFWAGANTLTLARRAGMYTTSFPAIVYECLQLFIGKPLASEWVSGASLLLTVIAAIGFGIAAMRNRSEPAWQAFTRAGTQMLLFYTLVTCLWFQVWYLLWAIGLAALLPTGALQGLAIGVGFAVLTKPLAVVPIVLWKRPWLPQPLLEFRLTGGVMGAPWLASLGVIYAGWRKRITRLKQNETR